MQKIFRGKDTTFYQFSYGISYWSDSDFIGYTSFFLLRIQEGLKVKVWVLSCAPCEFAQSTKRTIYVISKAFLCLCIHSFYHGDKILLLFRTKHSSSILRYGQTSLKADTQKWLVRQYWGVVCHKITGPLPCYYCCKHWVFSIAVSCIYH